MKSIFDTTTRDELINRISLLNEHSQRQWGEMNVYQMIRHSIAVDEMYLGKRTYKQGFLGKLFGRIALGHLLNGEKLMARNSPTVPEFKIQTKTGNIETEKSKWISLIEAYSHNSTDTIIHPFFGRINKEQIGHLVYKHTDHHLRQFNT